MIYGYVLVPLSGSANQHDFDEREWPGERKEAVIAEQFSSARCFILSVSRQWRREMADVLACRHLVIWRNERQDHRRRGRGRYNCVCSCAWMKRTFGTLLSWPTGEVG